MVNLSGSRWAPSSSRTTSQTPFTLDPTNNATVANTNGLTPSHPQPRLNKSQRDLLTRHNDSLKCAKLLQRLQWKSQTLLYCYHRALDTFQRQQNTLGNLAFPMAPGEAETMFKIDFFEFYVLLERVLVHLLGMLGMVVHPVYVSADGDGLRAAAPITRTNSNRAYDDQKNNTNADDQPIGLREELLARRGLIGDSRTFHGYSHRFHANVLSALDLPDNPLHGVLGTGVVRDYLGIAKEFRNRWKDAEEKPEGAGEDNLAGSRYEKMLNDLRLELMLGEIVMALIRARLIAEEELARFASTVQEDGGLKEAMMELDEGGAVGDAPWEAMSDAMEWD